MLSVTSKRKAILFASSALLLGLGAGCSGVNASKSVSPLDFLIPGGGGLLRGLLYVPPSVPRSPMGPTFPAPEISKQVAFLC